MEHGARVGLEASVTRKVMLRVAPMLSLLYLLFSVDRGNVGFAGLQMRQALGLSAEAFGIGSGLFTFGYLLFQVPNAVWLRRLGGGAGFAAIACAWGALSTLTAFVPNEHWFFANRFLLGVSEAGFNAFVIYYIQQWFPRNVRGFAIGLTLVAVPISIVIASPLSGWVLNLHWRGLSGWQAMFIVEGVPSLIVGLLCLKLVPRNVSDMHFLSEEERSWLRDDLNIAGQPAQLGIAKGSAAALTNPTVWALGFILFTTTFAANVMLIWMPQMIQQVSRADNVAVGLINCIPWIALGLGLVVMGRYSDKAASRMTPLVLSLGIAALGFVLAATLQGPRPYLGFCGFTLGAFGVGAAQGVFWALTVELMRGAGASTAYAVIGVLGNGSGLFAHPLIGRLRDVTGSFSGVAWALAAFNLAAVVIALLLARKLGGAAPKLRQQVV
jgi:ACS family tartrate transporter-like MFS transporter